MTYVERVIKQLRRPGVVKIEIQLTEYYEKYGDYDGQDDETSTYSLVSNKWISEYKYVDVPDDGHCPRIGGWLNSLDDAIDEIISDLYNSCYSIRSIKTFTEGDTIGTDVNF